MFYRMKFENMSRINIILVFNKIWQYVTKYLYKPGVPTQVYEYILLIPLLLHLLCLGK